MGVKWKTTKDDFPKVKSQIDGINGKSVQVGANWANAWLAAIHEYGCTIKVTPKMRAYLHSQGLHLKADTTTIKIPERSFLRSGHDKYVDKVLDITEQAIGQVISGKMTEQQFIDLVGEQMATHIKTYMRDLSSPANHPFTVEQKGSSNPLVNTGQLIESITWGDKL